MQDPANHTVPDTLLRRAARESKERRSSSACLEPDVLAAWADRTLSANEVQALETHAAGCVRCRVLLDAMIQVEPAPSPRPAWWKAPVLRWAAPLAAVAGALIVWVALDRSPARTLDSPPSRAAVVERKTVPEQRPAETTEQGAGKTFPQAQAKAAESRETQARSPATREAPSPPPARAQAPAAAPATPAAAARSQFAAGAVDAMASPEIVSPDPSSRWRIGTPGAVGRSTDGGHSWEMQAVDTNARLIAGASPSPVVCWVVGAAGTVLKTTDGRTWQHLPAPDPSDLLAVTARDANTATVTTADGRTFRTADGGLTWSSIPVQENPPAPFQG